MYLTLKNKSPLPPTNSGCKQTYSTQKSCCCCRNNLVYLDQLQTLVKYELSSSPGDDRKDGACGTLRVSARRFHPPLRSRMPQDAVVCLLIKGSTYFPLKVLTSRLCACSCSPCLVRGKSGRGETR